MNNYFSSNLRFLREKRGMEQLELAQLLGRKSAAFYVLIPKKEKEHG